MLGSACVAGFEFRKQCMWRMTARKKKKLSRNEREGNGQVCITWWKIQLAFIEFYFCV
jgi:hypothetical protein